MHISAPGLQSAAQYRRLSGAAGCRLWHRRQAAGSGGGREPRPANTHPMCSSRRRQLKTNLSSKPLSRSTSASSRSRCSASFSSGSAAPSSPGGGAWRPLPRGPKKNELARKGVTPAIARLLSCSGAAAHPFGSARAGFHVGSRAGRCRGGLQRAGLVAAETATLNCDRWWPPLHTASGGEVAACARHPQRAPAFRAPLPQTQGFQPPFCGCYAIPVQIQLPHAIMHTCFTRTALRCRCGAPLPATAPVH